MKPFVLRPCCKDYIWGGDRLRDFGKVSDADKIAESWELSCHPDGESVIASGEFAGETLPEFLQAHPEAAGQKNGSSAAFPALVKLIDAHDDLSVQVHPDKTELWYVIDAEPGASVLYGFRRELTRQEFRRAVENGSLLGHLNRIPAKRGDVFLIPAGTIHAIGKGLLVAEVQQNSNTTYRIYDYGRGRELHIEQALGVTNLKPITTQSVQKRRRISGIGYQSLGDCAHFSVSRFELRRALRFEKGAFCKHLLVLDGEGELTAEGERLPLKKGGSVFIPADTRYQLSGECTIIYTAAGGVRNYC